MLITRSFIIAIQQATDTVPEIQQQAGKILTQLAGYIGVRTIELGLRFGLFTGRAFYTRLIPDGLSRIPGLTETLSGGAHILELACSSGTGLIRLAQTYPQCHITGVDGDSYSLELTAKLIHEAGLSDRISLQQSMLETLDIHRAYDVVTINISMHECRDLDKVTAHVYNALKPGGHFIISDFPFPNTTEDCRTVPARIMCGIQFLEALIDDQLMPTQAFVDLLNRHHFQQVASFDLAPVHAVTYGQK